MVAPPPSRTDRVLVALILALQVALAALSAYQSHRLDQNAQAIKGLAVQVAGVQATPPGPG